MNSLICEESLERYVRLINGLLPNASAVGVCNAQGHLVQSPDLDGRVEITRAVNKLSDKNPEWFLSEETEVQSGPGSEQGLITAPILNGNGEIVGALAVLLSGDLQQANQAPLLRYAADCIGQELSLNQELDSMTNELTARYEELNLVYHTEDQVNYFREGRDALKNLTQNCLDYLDVGMSVLILKEKGVSISCNHPNEPIPNRRFVKEQLSDRLYAQVREANSTVVINEMTDSLAIQLLPGLPYKVLCCPIVDGQGKVAGILATVNHYSKTNFSNSDRNLLQVMARKASKIIAANYDPLTGLINRNGYEYFLESALAQAQSAEIEKSLLHINIDQLHILNDTVGHAAGDAAIQAVAALIDCQKRECDTLSRLGGDEFGLLLHNCSSKQAGELAERICRAIEKSPVEFKGEQYKVTVSIGAAMMTSANSSAGQVVGFAELACSVAKDQGQNRVEMYQIDNVDMVRREEQMHLVAHIQSALAEDRFELYCQEIRPLRAGGRHHTEVLMRLIDKNGDIMAPGNFIPAAERYHLMPSVDRWVVHKTLDMLSQFDVELISGGVYAINLSGQSMTEKDFLEFIHNQFETHNVPPECICFEVTETAAVANLEKAIKFMVDLKKLGCSFSLDDFGSGLSSFGYLKSLPVDYLKIDGAIVKDIVTDDTSAAMVAAINEVGHTMNLLTIAEFVENDAIKSCLERMGVDYAQGYGIGRPERFADRLRTVMIAPTAVAS